jgi:hypothetical protein
VLSVPKLHNEQLRAAVVRSEELVAEARNSSETQRKGKFTV